MRKKDTSGQQLKMLSVIIEEINTIYGSKGDTGVRTKAANDMVQNGQRNAVKNNAKR